MGVRTLIGLLDFYGKLNLEKAPMDNALLVARICSILGHIICRHEGCGREGTKCDPAWRQNIDRSARFSGN